MSKTTKPRSVPLTTRRMIRALEQICYGIMGHGVYDADPKYANYNEKHFPEEDAREQVKSRVDAIYYAILDGWPLLDVFDKERLLKSVEHLRSYAYGKSKLGDEADMEFLGRVSSVYRRQFERRRPFDRIEHKMAKHDDLVKFAQEFIQDNKEAGKDLCTCVAPSTACQYPDPCTYCRFLFALERLNKSDRDKYKDAEPCPFCGGQSIFTTELDGRQIAARCDNCYASGPNSDQHKKARIAWDTRRNPGTEK